jgi:hypothetical protein
VNARRTDQEALFGNDTLSCGNNRASDITKDAALVGFHVGLTQHDLRAILEVMAARPVQISLDEKLLRALDSDPETKKRGRSAVVRVALLHYLAAKRTQKIDSAIRAAYERIPDDDDDLDAFIAGQAWPAR